MTRSGKFRAYQEFEQLPESEMLARAHAFNAQLNRRRSVRDFSDRPVPRGIIEDCLMAASSAPSGANLQPWKFVVVSDPQVKRQIRQAAEEEEQRFYEVRAPQSWLDDLEPLGTDANKPFLERAPYLIIVFGVKGSQSDEGDKQKHYYVNESVGIATGMLITAIHNAGLVALTHTPAPMGFLREVLERPESERPFLILVVGYPEEGVEVPDIHRKTLADIAEFIGE